MTSLAHRTTAGPGRGSFKVTHSRNGNRSDQVPFYGFTGSVSRHPALTLSQTLMTFPFRSRCWQERALVC